MAKRKNDLTPAIERLLERLNETTYISATHSSMTDSRVKEYRAYLADVKATKVPAQRYGFGVSARVAVPSLIGKLKYTFPHGGFDSANEMHLKALEEIDGRLRAQLLVMAFEAVEAYFKEIGAHILFLARSGTKLTIPLNKKHVLSPAGKASSKLAANTRPYFAAYLKAYCSQGCDGFIKDLGKAFPRFAELSVKNKLGEDLVELFKVVSFCRNFIVHGSAEFPLTALKRLPAGWAPFVKAELLRQSFITKKLTILLPSNFLKQTLEELAAFAVLLYEVASDDLGLENDLVVEAKWKQL